MNIAFAGFRHGHINSLYRIAQNTPGLKIVAACEENDAARKAAEEALGVDFSRNDYDVILKSPDVDIIALGGCYGVRGEMAVEALRAGKHVIADKPLCTSLGELYEIGRLAEKSSLCVGLMLDLRYTPCAAAAKKFVSEGRLGEINAVSFTGQHCLNYGVRPSWYFEKGRHGGTLNDIAIHGIDLVRFISGLELAKVEAARCWNAFAKSEPDFLDCAQFMAVLDNGAGLIADVSYSAPKVSYPLPTYWRMTFWGTKGVLEFGCEETRLHVALSGSDEPLEIECEAPGGNCLLDFLDDIAGKKPALNTSEVIASTGATLTVQRASERKGF